MQLYMRLNEAVFPVLESSMQEYVVKPHLLSSAQCLCVYDTGLVHLRLFIIFYWFLQKKDIKRPFVFSLIIIIR